MVDRLMATAITLALVPDMVGRSPVVLGALFLVMILLAPLAVPAFVVILWIYPRARSWLAREQLRSRRRAILPDLLLALRLEAEDGAGSVQSLLALEPEAFPSLDVALDRFRDDLRTSYDVRTSLRTFADTLDLPEGRRLVEALLAGESLGVPLRQTLINQESMVRARRLGEIRQRAGYIPYVLTTMTGLLFINGAILLGYPRLLALLSTLSFHVGAGI